MQSITPNLGPFAESLGPKIIMIVGLVWLLCIVAVVCLLLKGTVEFGASRAGGRPMSTADGVLDIGVPLAALIFLGIIPAAVQAAISSRRSHPCLSAVTVTSSAAAAAAPACSGHR